MTEEIKSQNAQTRSQLVNAFRDRLNKISKDELKSIGNSDIEQAVENEYKKVCFKRIADEHKIKLEFKTPTLTKMNEQYTIIDYESDDEFEDIDEDMAVKYKRQVHMIRREIIIDKIPNIKASIILADIHYEHLSKQDIIKHKEDSLKAINDRICASKSYPKISTDHDYIEELCKLYDHICQLKECDALYEYLNEQEKKQRSYYDEKTNGKTRATLVNEFKKALEIMTEDVLRTLTADHIEKMAKKTMSVVDLRTVLDEYKNKYEMNLEYIPYEQIDALYNENRDKCSDAIEKNYRKNAGIVGTLSHRFLQYSVKYLKTQMERKDAGNLSVEALCEVLCEGYEFQCRLNELKAVNKYVEEISEIYLMRLGILDKKKEILKMEYKFKNKTRANEKMYCILND